MLSYACDAIKISLQFDFICNLVLLQIPDRTTDSMLPKIEKNVNLAERTTIGLGGPARLFCRCRTLAELGATLGYVREQSLPLFVLGGGSNVIFADRGFDGLVLEIALTGIEFCDEGQTVRVRAAAGEEWDSFVLACIKRDLAGIECLSGIPGRVGSTPIQNVGAYGQEVGETIERIHALDVQTLETVSFARHECDFAYRRSRFKGADRGRFVITAVEFRLRPGGSPDIKYPELQRALQAALKDVEVNGAASGREQLPPGREPLPPAREPLPPAREQLPPAREQLPPGREQLPPGRESLMTVRDTVLALRRGKSMTADPADPNARSCGSFFLNPVLTPEEHAEFLMQCRKVGLADVPAFVQQDGVKVPAAWLVERAGFNRGFRLGGAGISDKHALALVNRGGTAAELLALASAVERVVFTTFGIRLEREPVIVE